MEVRNGKGSLTRLIAGLMLIITSLLTALHDPRWWIASFIIGISHVVSAITGFCVMERILVKVFGFKVIGRD